MLTLSTRNQVAIGAALVLLLIVTRGHHLSTLHNLPGASWAVFLLAGIYLRPAWVLPGLLALTWGLDFVAFQWGGVSDFCFSPAYLLLLPAYAALWLAGCWYAQRYRFEWSTLMPLTLATVVGAAICELFSSGGFYLFSGRFAELSWAEFTVRELTYFPPYLQSLAFYVGVAAIVHSAFTVVHKATNQQKAAL
ncbi:MAG: hypothetical protein GXP10_06690 [Gammaproteobacteria bacterium]|nr:hypothetical protein [Gammaproteobacteria bacterium]